MGRTATRTLVAALMVCVFAMSALARDFTVITEGNKLGFREGNRTYTLGMDARQFEQGFGPPEDEEISGGEVRAVRYNSQGVLVVTDVKDGKVHYFVFHLKGVSNPREAARYHFKPATAKTDKGLTVDATIEQVMAAYGKPFERKDYIDERRPGDMLRYVRHGQGLKFYFVEGKLTKIIVSR